MTTLTAPLVGMRHHPGAAEKLSELGFGDSLTLVREPENAFDENAIKVFSLDGIFLGYIAREYASEWAPVFDDADIPPATLSFGSEGRPRVEISLGDAAEEPQKKQKRSQAMPFQKVTGGRFKSPSGKLYTKKQVALYHAHDGFPQAPKKAPAKKRAAKSRRKRAKK